MKSNDTIDEVINLLLTAYSRYIKDRESSFKVYKFALKDENPLDVGKAVAISIKTNKFPPTPAEILELIHGNALIRSLRAWKTITMAIELYGPNESIKFKDPKINEAIDLLGGWIELATTDKEDLKWIKKEFLEMYPYLHGNDKRCIGYIEKQNAIDGYKTEYVIEIPGGKRIPLERSKHEQLERREKRPNNAGNGKP